MSHLRGARQQRVLGDADPNTVHVNATWPTISLCYSTITFEKNIFLVRVLCETYHEFFIVVILPDVYQALQLHFKHHHVSLLASRFKLSKLFTN